MSTNGTGAIALEVYFFCMYRFRLGVVLHLGCFIYNRTLPRIQVLFHTSCTVVRNVVCCVCFSVFLLLSEFAWLLVFGVGVVVFSALWLRTRMERSEGWPLCTASAAVPQSSYFLNGASTLYIDVNMHSFGRLSFLCILVLLLFFVGLVNVWFSVRFQF